ncbi:MAG: rhodanese-like domain-containing protein [Gammaproteobacteria bacterium]|nr:rhodanese-like domain-containing protein [Gammaproteobacteria bacterium]
MAKRKSTRKKQQKNNRNILIGVAGVIIIGLIGAVVFSNQAAPATTSQATALPLEVSVQEAYRLREEGKFVLDVRTQEEWNSGHVPGATLIPLGELSNRLDEVPEGEDIVVICRSGNRSATARDILLGAGFSSVTSVAGGFNDWVVNGYEVAVGP